MPKKYSEIEAANTKVKEMPPFLSISETHLPEVKAWQVGKKYKLNLDVTQTGMSQDKDKKYTASFEINNAKSV